jgi:Single-strand binding protein family
MTKLAVAEAPSPQFQVMTLVGNLTADPVRRTIDENRKVCDMRLAVNDHNDQPPLFIDVATSGSQAEACAKYLAKGRASTNARALKSKTRREPSPSVVGRFRLRRCSCKQEATDSNPAGSTPKG